MKSKLLPLLSGEVLEEDVELTVDELCRICHLSIEEVRIVVEEGIVEPTGWKSEVWRFRGASVKRVRSAIQMREDLGINWAGAALALELLDELRELRQRQIRLEGKS